MEVPKMMRYATPAGRIRKGVPILATLSPDEKHNVAMLCLFRCRQRDPMNTLHQSIAVFGKVQAPSITNAKPMVRKDAVDSGLPLEEILQWLPAYDDRRTILARDSLASVEGFRMSI